MLKLIQSGLFGGKLHHVATKELVERYNACLEDIGLERTKLKEFHIDGWGWSPEIAEEQHNKHYLSHGSANPYSIIITPEQQQGSLYYPYHSFDWDIHHQVFDKYAKQIFDITTDRGLWLALDQDISVYRSPQDLLMIDVVKVQFKTPGNLISAAREQRELVRTYFDKPMAWADRELRQRISASAKEYGDLRFRNIEVLPFPYTEIRAFYTSAFDGLYVLRDTIVGKPVLIMANNSSAVSGELQHAHVEFNLNDPALVGFLFSKGLVQHSYAHFEEVPALLVHQLDLLIANASLKLDDPVELIGLTDSKRKGLINTLQAKGLLGDDYFQLEEVRRSFLRKEKVRSEGEALIRDHLIHPVKVQNVQVRTVIWQLIANIFAVNELVRYTFNKPDFYHRYKAWPEPYQRWVIKELQEHRGIFGKLTA
ncbi:MAG: hypothetical protein JNL43_11120 [Flavobacteriales bacterium]|nr:hypothetical protein [Flavobacteriales bacterium]